MRTQGNLARHELIGLSVRVSRSPDPSVEGVEGRVVDETRNTLVLERADGRRAIRVPKAGCAFRFALPNGTFAELEGSFIAFRPEDRVKRCR
ncbi:MAG: ribonuclease P protein subunit [Euryarchaeota archaeon]|nr:ribonuclease P protein subunit [Euryarchaeota archaeon]